MLKKIKNWFIRDDASAAVEFTLVGMPFIIMLVGIVEMCLFFATAINLEGATQAAARLIRTGQVQSAGNPLQAFENELCQQVSGLISCTSLQYQVVPVTGNNFSTLVDLTTQEMVLPQFDAQGNLINQGFNPGVSNQDILVRVVYQYTFLTPLIGNMITKSSSSKATIMSAIIIENEPYQFGIQ